MKLYDVAASPNCRKVRVLARELGLSIEIIPVDLSAPRATAYVATNPTGKVPTLIDHDGTVVWESGAILVHLAEKRADAELLPRESRARSEVFRWMFFAATHVQPWMSILGQERILKPRRGEVADAALVAHAERELARVLVVLDDALESREYLAQNFTIADVFVGCGFDGAESRGVFLNRHPHLFAWRERLRARPSWNDPPPPHR